MTALPVAEMIRRDIASMPQKKNAFEEFTVEKNLLTSAAIYPKSTAKERVQGVYETQSILKAMRRRTPFHLCSGCPNATIGTAEQNGGDAVVVKKEVIERC